MQSAAASTGAMVTAIGPGEDTEPMMSEEPRPPAIEHLEGPTGRLRVGRWAAEGEGAAGTVVLLPGRTEFVEKYADTGAWLAGQGYAAAVLDWQGQGASFRLLPNPRKGHVADFSAYLDDLGLLLARLAAQGSPEPFLMLAHSMGGHIGLRWLAERDGRHAPRFGAAAMVAPMFDIVFGPLPRGFVRRLAGLAARIGGGHLYAPGQGDALARPLRRFETNPLTTCPERYRRWRALLERHPDHGIGGVTFGWLDAALRSIAITRAPGYLEAITVPVLVCQAAEETIVCNRAQAELAARLPRGELAVFAGARHDLLWEQAATRAALLERIVGFFSRATAGEARARAP